MSATVYGSVNFGLSDETGFYVQSVDYDVKVEDKWIADGSGCDVAGATYNPSADWSLNGVRKTDEALSAAVGASMVLANVIDFTEFIDGYVSGGISILLGHKAAMKNDDFQMGDLSGKFKPFVAAV